MPLTGNEFVELSYQGSSVVALADSTVFTFFSALETQGDNVSPAAVQVGKDGSRLSAVPSVNPSTGPKKSAHTRT